MLAENGAASGFQVVIMRHGQPAFGHHPDIGASSMQQHNGLWMLKHLNQGRKIVESQRIHDKTMPPYRQLQERKAWNGRDRLTLRTRTYLGKLCINSNYMSLLENADRVR